MMSRSSAVPGRCSSVLLALLALSPNWALADGSPGAATTVEEALVLQGNRLKQQELSADDLALIYSGQALLDQSKDEKESAVVEPGHAISQQAPSDPDRQLIALGEALKQQPLAETEKTLVDSAVSLNTQPLAEADQALITHGQAIVEQAHSEYQQAVADGSGTVAVSSLPNLSAPGSLEIKPSPKLATEPTIWLFSSWSLGEKGLDELLEAAAHYPNATVVLRGVPEGMNLARGLKKIQTLAAKKNPMPHIVVDPLLFTACQVHDIPTIVLLKPGTPLRQVTPQHILASVRGLSDPTWLLNQVAGGARGDQGTQGPVREIQEPDLLLTMQSRAMEIDWEAKKRSAITGFWQKQPFYALAAAVKTRRRLLDPTIVITEDIKGPDGQLIAAKGSHINPLSLRPFTQAIVIFDPLDNQQRTRVQQALPTIQQAAKARRVTYIATQFCREQGWDFYRKITDELAAPVYLLTPDMIERFSLQYTPTIITATERHFVVQELAREE